MNNNKSLATGAELDADTFADFLKRLHHDCVGEGVHDHCTSNAIFIVEKRVIICGIDTDYTEKLMAYDNNDTECSWYSINDLWRDLSNKEKIFLNKSCVDIYGEKFKDLFEFNQWQMIKDIERITVTGWDERWDYVNAHFTKDAAEAFISRKKHDYRDGLRVYVDSQYWAWEFNAIKKALLDGTLVYQPKIEA